MDGSQSLLGHERGQLYNIDKVVHNGGQEPWRPQDGRLGMAEEGLAVGFRLATPTLFDESFQRVWHPSCLGPRFLGTLDKVGNQPTAASLRLGVGPSGAGQLSGTTRGHLRLSGDHLVAGAVARSGVCLGRVASHLGDQLRSPTVYLPHACDLLQQPDAGREETHETRHCAECYK